MKCFFTIKRVLIKHCNSLIKIPIFNMNYQMPMPYEPFYNFEHEDITFTALVNSEMIKAIYYILCKCVPYLPFLAKMTATIYAVFRILKEGSKYLTPGYELLELSCMASSALVVGAFAYIITKMTNELNEHLAKLKEEQKEKNEYIEELEKENEEMKSTFRTMMTYADPKVMQRKSTRKIKN